MTHVLTLVAPQGSPDLDNKLFTQLRDTLGYYNLEISGKPRFLAKSRAAEMDISGRVPGPLVDHLREMLAPRRTDFFILPHEGRRKRLLLADMDSTIVTSETLDELAEYAGIKDRIAEITARAMEGKIDFHDALRERVGLLKGLPESTLHQTLTATQLSSGAQTLVRTMRANGAQCVLVSGGFTFFTGAIAEQAGFHAHHGNVLGIAGGELTGEVIPPILDKYAKLDFLKRYARELAITTQDCMTIGDGANDIPMLKEAGFGVGYQPKQAVLNEVANAIIYGDLTAALYAQGYTADQFA